MTHPECPFFSIDTRASITEKIYLQNATMRLTKKKREPTKKYSPSFNIQRAILKKKKDEGEKSEKE